AGRRGAELGFPVRAVPLSRAEVEGFYQGFSNSIVWPLFHDRLADIAFAPEHYDAYRAVNRRFAGVVAGLADAVDLVWVHDYHLFHVGEELRVTHPDRRLGFFLHIPFPAPDLFRRLPWRDALLRALLAYDLVGVQHARDADNLVANLRAMPEPPVVTVDGGEIRVGHPGGTTRIAVLPIGIDPRPWEARAQRPEVVARLDELRRLQPELKLVLGVDRLDETKGLFERLRAWEHLIRTRPALRGRVQLVQLVVPSRENVPRYKQIKRDVERMVGEINGALGMPGWAPISHLYRAVPPDELTALYRVADVCIVSSIKDGMNLVAMEYCAAQVDEIGALVLSEFAGAADLLGRWAWIVNPHDRVGTADAIVAALDAPLDERRRRMRALRRLVHDNDVYAWVDRFVQAVADAPGDPPRSVAAGGEADPAVGASRGPVVAVAS
ncbi:MAG: trehalose-6-phosphate synthase, partial [Myxococcota bacterium]